VSELTTEIPLKKPENENLTNWV